MKTSFTDELWNLIIASYDRPGAAALLITAQDRWGLDVSLALALLHADIIAGGQQRLFDRSAHWQAQLLQPLRLARRAAKELAGPLYDQLKSCEVDAERAALEDYALELQPGQGSQLEAYCRHMGIEDEGVIRDLRSLKGPATG